MTNVFKDLIDKNEKQILLRRKLRERIDAKIEYKAKKLRDNLFNFSDKNGLKNN